MGEIRFGVSLGDNMGLQVDSFLDVERGDCLWVRERSIHPIDSSDFFNSSSPCREEICWLIGTASNGKEAFRCEEFVI
jgi:hypothetical protein